MSSSKSWPNLVGKPADEAVAAIQKENPSTKKKQSFLSSKILSFIIDLSVIKLEEGSPITNDLRNDRVHVFFDKNGKVSSEPTIA
jgi:hypothetical protein